jgi:Domain of unknown function (DUF4276)
LTVAKKVVVIVSGEIDRRSIPHLCRDFVQHAELFEMRKPPANAALTPEQAVRLIKAAWYGRGDPPEKFVVLVDSDARDPADAAKPFEDAIAALSDVRASRLVAVAIRHLEAWFFGHSEKLRDFLGRDLGSIDSSRPDEIDNPKLHLTHLLDSRSRVYTAPVAAQIAALLDPLIIEGRSPSFASFIAKLQNGSDAHPG